MEGTIPNAPIPDNFAYVLVVDEGEVLHTPEHPFCWDATCPCHSDQEAFTTVQQAVFTGLLTPDEATLFVAGKTV